MRIEPSEYSARRQRLIASCKPNSIIVIPSASEVTRSRDTEFTFRQNSDFYYLTGFNEPDSMLVISNANAKDDSSCRVLIFLRAKDAHAEIWHGRRLGIADARQELGVDSAFDINNLSELLPDLIDGHSCLYASVGQDAGFDKVIFNAMNICKNAPKQSKTAPQQIIDPLPLLHAMRRQKSASEIEVMRRAGEISCQAHENAMQLCKVGMFEYQLEAHIRHHFAMNGAREPAYNSIVGGGDNACILHYTENSDVLNDGDLVLIDAGCEYQGYAADITRTFPVNGKFSEAQRALYDICLEAQEQSIKALIPGSTIDQAMQIAVNTITKGLLKLGILNGDLDTLIAEQAHKAFFMHGLGHYLGLDVHDVGDYKQNGEDIPLQEGMVLTVEPGIYISEAADAPAQYKGIGIRIEDNIVITATGNENLTASLVKHPDDIEALMAGGKP